MKNGSPTVDLVGDWTSARLLTRLLAVIDSPWELGTTALEHRETGERCSLEMRGPDPDLCSRIAAGDDPVAPSLTDEMLEQVRTHKSVIRIRALGCSGKAAARAVLRFTSNLVDVGALAACCLESGVAHAASRWQEFEDRAGEVDDTELPLVLRDAFVAPLLRDGGGFCTRGMALLGTADVAADAGLPEAIALDAMMLLATSLSRGQARDPWTVRFANRKLRASCGPDPRPVEDPAHNPFGVWRVVQVSR